MSYLKYHLTFEPDLKKSQYKGVEEITLPISHKKTKTLELDSVGIKVEKVTVENGRPCRFRVTDNNLLVILPDLKSGKSEIKIKIAFTNSFSEGLAGWYKSFYMEGKKQRYFVTTHFEPADARRVFPCFDKPSIKAVFKIVFIIDGNLKAVSNMLPVKGEKLPHNKKRIEFADTPPMSTYLLYLGVGNLEIITDTFKKVLLRGITTPGKSEYARFSLGIAKKTLAYFEDYFDFPYPLPTLDLIAVPDFSAGAMENWGAITFRENAMLLYPTSSKSTRMRIAEVVAHELAHQWFGNLVTMDWWDDLWLNESFATFMAYKAVDRFFPKWRVWDEYVMSTVFEGMSLDSLNSSHPIKVSVEKEHEIEELFDEIAYDKGGSILRMLEMYLGENLFRDGLRRYIKNYTYKNASAKDLWEKLETSSNLPITKLMGLFVTKTGFPEVRVEKIKDRLHISQKRFLFLDTQVDESPWSIPLVIKTKTGVLKYLLVTVNEALPINDGNSSVYVNKKYGGFFVTSYSKELLEENGLHVKNLSVVERIGLLHDIWYTVVKGEQSVSGFVDYIQRYFLMEADATVRLYALGKLNRIVTLFPTEVFRQLLSRFAKKTLTTIGKEPESKENPTQTLLRNQAISSLAYLNDNEIRQFVLRKFELYLKDEFSLSSDLRAVVYASAVWFSDANFATVLDHYRKTHIQEEKAKLLSALGQSQNKKLIKQALDFSLTTEVRFANSIYLLISLSNNYLAKDIAFAWLLKHWKDVLKKSEGMATMLLRRILQSFIPDFGVNHEKEVEIFFTKNKLPALEKTYKQVHEELMINSRFIRREKGRLFK